MFDEDKLVIIQNKFQANIKFILTNVLDSHSNNENILFRENRPLKLHFRFRRRISLLVDYLSILNNKGDMMHFLFSFVEINLDVILIHKMHHISVNLEN